MTDPQEQTGDQPLASGPLVENDDEPTPIFDGVSTEKIPIVLIDSTLEHDDEYPEEHIGEELIDPWVDPEQTDWPMADDLELQEEEDS